MKDIVFATNNAHKLRELREITAGVLNVLSLADINCHEDIAETAETIEGNAIIKANYIKEHYGYDCFADDTGLEVDALGGEPGVRSARYAGEDCISENNIDLLLHRLEGKSQRSARFRTAIALRIGNDVTLFEGIVNGNILTERHGTGGFGYDSVFAPVEADGRSFAEMSADEKNAISHRGRATAALINYLLHGKS
ncbi:MAG: RdgB/HAM1 family non-canonical purine NTP pyrophosphatase [bacterium]|nr:RdgB/HAM1 family non-canonical purine NTP pyrophosphatase [bacterium]